MGENVKTNTQQSTADQIREQIRHTEGDITQTVETLEERLSPRSLRREGSRKVKLFAWRGTARLFKYAQRTSVQISTLGASVGVSALLMALGKRRARRSVMPEVKPGKAAKAAGAGALWMLLRKGVERRVAERPAVSGVALALTAAKAFLGGARGTKKSGTTEPGRKVAWRSVATAIGAAMGSYWYSHKGHRV